MNLFRAHPGQAASAASIMLETLKGSGIVASHLTQ